MDHPRPGLRYVDADDLDSSTIDFDGLNVESYTGEKLGTVDGFIIDINAARPVYIVVNAGGWLRSKYFLLPVGSAALDSTNKRLIAADVTRDRVSRYPGFDRDEFKELKDEELARMDEQMTAAWCPDRTLDSAAYTTRYTNWKEYTTPSWWDASYYRPDRAETTSRSMGASFPTREEVRAERDRERERDRELVTAQSGDVSPHLGGRAQPGDVLGLETGGERTYVGDTTDDENKRREDAIKDARKKRD
jgi:hypothetical protein